MMDTSKTTLWQPIKRGIAKRCPRCGVGKLYSSYTKPNMECSHCKLDLSHQQADDAPPYLVIFIVGHIIVAGVLILERTTEPALWIHAALWLPLTLLISMWLLPIAKGAVIAWQWAMKMHGFDENQSSTDQHSLDKSSDTLH
jgi:uncharacterized protein (DUF983 family)